MPNPQNGQAHLNDLSAIYRRFVWVCLTILLIWHLKPVYFWNRIPIAKYLRFDQSEIDNVCQCKLTKEYFRIKSKVTKYKSRRSEMFRKKVLKNFAKFVGKHLWQSFFLNKVAGLSSATLLKKKLWHRCFLWIFEFFRSTYFYKTPLVTASENNEEMIPFMHSYVQKLQA